jgi:hypothetical protein
MNTLQITFPFKPFNVTQKWGTSNPAYAAQFNDPAFKLHNGIDANVGTFDPIGNVVSEYPVYCPVENFRVVNIDYAPQGGGNEITLMSKDKLQMFDLQCSARIIMCHAKQILVKIGDEPALGELLMIADNTGFSTGIHTHMGLYRTNELGQKIDSNEATGSFDPSLFFTNTVAVDEASYTTLIKSNWRYYRYRLGLSG